MDLGLQGKLALVTGGGRGIGLAEAKALGAEGARIVLVDLVAELAQDAVSQLQAMGFSAQAFVGDATDPALATHVVDAVMTEHGRLDILVNNAGIGVKPAYAVQDMPEEAWHRMIHSHMDSTFLWSRAAIPKMKVNHYGRIINTCSMNFTGGGRPGVSHYAAAKAGILGFTQTMAKEVGPFGITANAIAPGYVETELIAQFTEEMRQKLYRQNPVGRTCQPSEVAALVAFLASVQAGFINGELVCIDGGRRDFYWGQ